MKGTTVNITASQVKQLRDITGVSMMKCKEALVETNGNLEEAQDYLRKIAGVRSERRAGNETSCGFIGSFLSSDRKVCALVLLACETDFVAASDEFKTFANSLAENYSQSIETPESDLDAIRLKVGENIQVKTVKQVIASDDETISLYVHNGRKAAYVVGTGDLKPVAMHITASDSSPVSVDRDAVPSDLLEKEKAIIAEDPSIQSKPENIRPKIIDGKLNKFYKEFVLLEQEMLVDNPDGVSVQKWLSKNSASISSFDQISL